MKHNLQKAKQPLKSGFLEGKSEFWGMKNYELSTKLERLNGAKCRSQAGNWTKNGTCKVEISA